MKRIMYLLLLLLFFSDLTCEHSNLCGSGDFLVLVANVHHVEDPGGAEAGQEEGQAEAEEGHDEWRVSHRYADPCTIVHSSKSSSIFCLSPVFGDKQQFDFSHGMLSNVELLAALKEKIFFHFLTIYLF